MKKFKLKWTVLSILIIPLFIGCVQKDDSCEGINTVTSEYIKSIEVEKKHANYLVSGSQNASPMYVYGKVNLLFIKMNEANNPLFYRDNSGKGISLVCPLIYKEYYVIDLIDLAYSAYISMNNGISKIDRI